MNELLQPRIVEQPSFTVIGIEASFIHALSPDATNFQVIPQLWSRLNQAAHQVSHRIGTTMYGVIDARPESERKHPHELQYLAAIPVSMVGEIPTGMVARTISAGLFAVFTHRGPIQSIGDTVHQIYRVWLPQSDYVHSEIADVEVYGERFCGDRPDSEMEYWISVAPKNAGVCS